MSVSHSSSTTSLMPQHEVSKSAPSSIWGALTSLFSPRGTPRDEDTQRIENEGSLPLFLSTQTPSSYPDGVSPPQPVAPSSLSKPMAYSSPSQRISPSSSESVASSFSSQPSLPHAVAISSLSHSVPRSSSSHPVRDFPPSEPVAGPSKQPRSPTTFQHLQPVETPLSPENQPENPFPPIIVRDFAYMPRPPLLNRPIDEQWVVNIMLPPGAVPGLREREAIEWEASHRHLYRLGGNRADPPNTVSKTWGGLSKAEDDEMMRRAQADITEAKQKTLALGLTPTEPNIGAPPQNYSAMTDEEREAIARIDASIKEQIATAQREGYGPPIETPPNTPPPLDRTRTRVLVPSLPPARPRTALPDHTSTRGSKRKHEESENEDVDSKVATSSKRSLRKRRTQKQDEDDAAMDTNTSRYFLRRPTPSSSSRTSSIKPTASSKGKGKARAP